MIHYVHKVFKKKEDNKLFFVIDIFSINILDFEREKYYEI